MPKKKYVLCIRIELGGKCQYYPIASASLIALTKYTTYCSDQNGLLRCMPDYAKDVFDCQINNLSVNRNLFVIRTSDSRKAKNVPVLYKDDIDVLLASKKELEKVLNTLVSISIEEYQNGSIPKDKKELLKELYNRFIKDKPKILTTMNHNASVKLNPDAYPDLRYEKPLMTGWIALGILKSNLSSLIDVYHDDFNKRIELALFLKEKYGKQLTDGVPKDELERRLNIIETMLKRNKESNYYIREQINDHVSKIDKNSQPKQPSDFNKPGDRYRLDEYEIKLMNEISEIQNKIKDVKEYLTKKGDSNSESRLYYLEEKLSQLEYELDGYQNGTIDFSDADLVIDKGKDI